MSFDELKKRFESAGMDLSKKGKTFRSSGVNFTSLSEAEKWLSGAIALQPGIYPVAHFSPGEAAGKTALELILPPFVGSPIEPERVYPEDEIIAKAIVLDPGAIDVQTALEVLSAAGEGYANNGNGWMRIEYK